MKNQTINFENEQNRGIVVQCSKFINDKEVIRKKAVVKYQNELKSRLQKMLEYDVLVQQLKKVQRTHDEFEQRVTNNKKFKDFLTVAIDMLPDSK